MSKMDQAVKLYESNRGKDQKEIVAMMVEKLGFPRPMAYTYYKNVAKRVGQKSDEPRQSTAKTTSTRAKTKEPEAQPAAKRVAKSTNKALHSILDLALQKFTDDEIPAFLKKNIH